MIELRNSRVLQIIPLILIAVLFCPLTYGKVIYVDDDAMGTNDGTSWADAYNYLQNALADASTAEKPVEIHVAQGLYKPDRGAEFTLGDKDAEFQLLSGVSIRGGFAGVGSIEPEARNIEAYKTILSGDLRGDDAVVINPDELSDEPTRAENSQRVVNGSYTDETAVLGGVSITAGKTGMDNHYGNPTLLNCTFTNARKGMFNMSGSPTLTNCTFKGHCENAISQIDGVLTLTDCLFSGNSGTSVDGHFSAELILRNCTFADNVMHSGGAIDCFGGNLRLYNCEFRNNIASWVAGVEIWANGELIAEDCTFAGNVGISIYHSRGRMVISNCVLAGNRGQAIESNGRYVTIRNCTFSDNYTDRDGSALDIGDESKVSNCIFWANSSPAIKTWPPGVVMDYCNAEGGWPGVGNINVDPGFVAPGHWELNGTPDDPDDDFWVGGDYRLLSQAGRWDPDSESWVLDDATSPCIDAGDPNGPIGVEPFPNGGRINMGAYGAGDTASKTYFGGPACDVILAGDINGDCVVDFDDLMIIISHWMMRGEDFVNKPPVVTLIEPQDGVQITWPGPTMFRAEAHDPDGEVDKVTFRLQQKRDDGTRTMGFGGHEGINGWEVEFDWQRNPEIPQGNWTVWAEATDNEGLVGRSPKIAITLYRP